MNTYLPGFVNDQYKGFPITVGHTGNQVDQLFSTLTSQFKSEITTIESLKHKIERTGFKYELVKLATIYNYFASLVYNLQPIFGRNKNLKNTPTLYEGICIKASVKTLEIKIRTFEEYFPMDHTQWCYRADSTPVKVYEA